MIVLVCFALSFLVNCGDTAGKTFFAKFGLTKPYHHPWLAQIHVKTSRCVVHCSGALINDRYVLTSQDCVEGVKPQDVTVELGFFNGYKTDISELFQQRNLTRRATGLILHPGWKLNYPLTAANNLALIKLDTPVTYSMTIYPIQLPSVIDQKKDHSHQPAEIVEWSFLSKSRKPVKKLRVETVVILEKNRCLGFLGRNVLCVPLYPRDNRGGLLLQVKPRGVFNTTVLLGISVYKSPARYSRIDYAMPWIKQNTADALYCHY